MKLAFVILFFILSCAAKAQENNDVDNVRRYLKSKQQGIKDIKDATATARDGNDVGRNRNRANLVDASACTDPSAFLTLPSDGICDFPFVTAGFIDEPSLVPIIEGFYRLEQTFGDSNDTAVLCQPDNIVSSYTTLEYAYIEFPDEDTSDFEWAGKIVLYRPPATSNAKQIPDGEGLLWEVQGLIKFTDGGDFTIDAFYGTVGKDICAILEEG